MTAGLEAVFLEHRATLLRFLRARGAADAAEDLLQELWLRIESKPPGPVADPLAYLHRMANNLMLDRYRASNRRERRERDWSDAGSSVLAEASDEAPADERLIAAERLATAEAALQALGPRVDTVFRRFRLDGIGQKQIAAELGVSLTTVEKDLQKAYRALLTLRRRFEDER